MSRIAAVVFDLDGVLIDSEPAWDAARRAVVAENGGTYRDEATRDVMGMSAAEWSRYIRERLGVDLADAEIRARVVDRLEAAYRRALPLFPGAVAAVRRIAAYVPVAIASASDRSLIDLVVERSGLGDAFAATVSADEVARGKPAPDVYLRAAERLGVSPRACGSVEDSTNGLRAAHAAGTFVVAIPNRGFPPDPAAVSLARVVLDDVAALEPATFGLPARAERPR